MRSYALLVENQIFTMTGLACSPISNSNYIFNRLRKWEIKTIFNLMICWELRLKLRLEYSTIRSFQDKLTCQFRNNLLPHAEPRKFNW